MAVTPAVEQERYGRLHTSHGRRCAAAARGGATLGERGGGRSRVRGVLRACVACLVGSGLWVPAAALAQPAVIRSVHVLSTWIGVPATWCSPTAAFTHSIPGPVSRSRSTTRVASISGYMLMTPSMEERLVSGTCGTSCLRWTGCRNPGPTSCPHRRLAIVPHDHEEHRAADAQPDEVGHR